MQQLQTWIVVEWWPCSLRAPSGWMVCVTIFGPVTFTWSFAETCQKRA